VTLGWLARSLDQKKMNGVASSIGDKDPALRELVADFAKRGSLYTNAYAGMHARLSALGETAFGPLFERTPALDLAGALNKVGVSYISLPALEASEDVELMARVLVQDVKQAAGQRISTGVSQPAMLLLDEFASLREAEQLNDLLLQAREARIACVVASQFLPHPDQAPALRHALMSAGLFVAHQLSFGDSEDVAGLFGTRQTIEATHQVDYETGFSGKGSFHATRVYRITPDELRELPRGTAAVRVEPAPRYTGLVKVYPPEGG
jgi:hypothetical protein